MSDALSFAVLPRLMTQPMAVFKALSERAPEGHRVFFQLILPLSLIPPVLAYVGGATFGWRLGGGEPLMMPARSLTLISLAYFFALIFGLVSSAAVSSWMGRHLWRKAGVRHPSGARGHGGPRPVILASVAHLAPHVFVNMLVLIPALIWSLYLLYRGLPEALGIPPERGMLMASALAGYLLVALVSLLGITVALWSGGIGPAIGVVGWRTAPSGNATTTGWCPG